MITYAVCCLSKITVINTIKSKFCFMLTQTLEREAFLHCHSE